MAQSSISSFFITRKRGIEDDAVSNKKKVICLESRGATQSNSSESRDSYADSEELATKVVFPSSKAIDGSISREDDHKTTINKKATVRQGITPQRTARNRNTQMHEVDGIETPKLVSFFKAGNLSPQKKSKSWNVKQPERKISSDSESLEKSHGMITPTKQIVPASRMNLRGSTDTVEMTTLMPSNSNGMKHEEIKKKLKGSSRLAELKTQLNKLQNGFDRLDKMELKRSNAGPAKEKSDPVGEKAPKTLKPFKNIELEILSPTKRLTSPMKLKDSPMKNTLLASPKILTPRKLFSPTKSPMKMSPIKAPAYQRFQNLAESGTPLLQLPFKYRFLLEIFKAVDIVCAMFFNRKEKITFKKLKPAVQRILRKNFFESHLAQVNKLMPEAYKFIQEKTRNFGSTSKLDYYQLVITPVVSSSDGDVKQLTLSPQILIERTKKFTLLLTNLVFNEHTKFLQSLDVPMNVTRGALKRWHPEFDLESVPDIEIGDLPQAPNVEKFSSAKDILSTARNLFSCSTPMERALERLEAKKKEEKSKQIQNQQQQNAKSEAEPSKGLDDANDEHKKQSTSAAPPPINSILKGVPKSLLDKIRAKQAAKALDTMTRRPSQERDAIKYSRLPEIARHARNVYVTEKKGVMPLELVLKKIENSYKACATLKEIEELLRMISNELPTWLSFHEIRNAMFVKLSRDADLSAVVVKLEAIANEKAKIH